MAPRIGNRNLVVIPLSEWRQVARVGDENIVVTVPDGTTAAEIMALAERIPQVIAEAKAAQGRA